MVSCYVCFHHCDDLSSSLCIGEPLVWSSFKSRKSLLPPLFISHTNTVTAQWGIWINGDSMLWPHSSLASGHNRDRCRWSKRPFMLRPPLTVKKQSYAIKWPRGLSSHCGVKTNYIIWSPSKSRSMLGNLLHLHCCWYNGKSQGRTTWLSSFSAVLCSSCPHIVMPQSSGCSGAFSESVR